MASKFNINAFLLKSPEEQAKEIEKQTKELIKRLPTLKKQLKMYGEVSSELYNLSQEEVELWGTTYAKAVRGGEITAPSSKQAYNQFIKSLHKYTRTDISTIASQVAEERMNSFIEHIEQNASQEEVDYVKKLVDGMTSSQKLAFTRSQYFLDVENWNSEGFKEFLDTYDYSISTLKLELFLETYDEHDTKGIYNTKVATDGTNKMRGAYRGKRARKRSK